MKKNMIIAMALGLIATSAQATLVVGELQSTSGATTLPGPITAVSGDLLESSFASVVGGATDPADEAILRDGVTGGARDQGGTMAGLWLDTGAALQTTYTLDTSLPANALGYAIEDVRVFTGWDSNRAQAGYVLSYSLVGSADFVTIGTVLSPADQGANNSSADWSFMTRTYDDLGGLIAGDITGVDAIRFDWDFTDNANGGSRGPVVREIDVIGYAIPEPATLGMVAVFGGGILFIRCRFMI